MQNIKWHLGKERENVLKIEVDEEDISFIHGIAVVVAQMTLITRFNEIKVVSCSGLINENFEELFSDASNPEHHDLMFFPCNKNILRCGENDFVVYSDHCNDDGFRSTYRHIRFVDNVPIFLGDFQSFPKKTALENMVLLYNSFYDLYERKSLTPTFFDVLLVNQEKGTYWIQDQLSLDLKGILSKREEYWNFFMDTHFSLLSPVYSSKNRYIRIKDLPLFWNGSSYVLKDSCAPLRFNKVTVGEAKDLSSYFDLKEKKLRELTLQAEDYNRLILERSISITGSVLRKDKK